MKQQHEIIRMLNAIDHAANADNLPREDMFLAICAALAWTLDGEIPPLLRSKYGHVVDAFMPLLEAFEKQIDRWEAQAEKN